MGTIESAYSGSKVTFFDTQPVFADILDNYQSYGFKDNSTYCDIYASISTQPALFLPQCGIPLAQYVWWNSGQSVCAASSSSSSDFLADVPDLAFQSVVARPSDLGQQDRRGKRLVLPASLHLRSLGSFGSLFSDMLTYPSFSCRRF